MKIFLLLLVLAFPLQVRAAAPAPGSGLPGAGQPYWLKIYSTAPYKEEWTGELDVADLERDLPKAVEKIEKGGGKLVQPLSYFASSRTDRTQQMSFTLSLENAKALLKSLRALGEIAPPAVRPVGAPIPLDEVRRKIDVLMKEKTGRAAALAQVPAAAAAAEEILEHLLMVEDVAGRVETEVRFNLLVKQK